MWFCCVISEWTSRGHFKGNIFYDDILPNWHIENVKPHKLLVHLNENSTFSLNYYPGLGLIDLLINVMLSPTICTAISTAVTTKEIGPQLSYCFARYGINEITNYITYKCDISSSYSFNASVYHRHTGMICLAQTSRFCFLKSMRKRNEWPNYILQI